MDARSAGKLGGRPTKAVSLGKRAAAAVVNGSQRTLNFAVGGAVHSRQRRRRARARAANEDAADGPADEADGQDEPADAADGAAA